MRLLCCCSGPANLVIITQFFTINFGKKKFGTKFTEDRVRENSSSKVNTISTKPHRGIDLAGKEELKKKILNFWCCSGFQFLTLHLASLCLANCKFHFRPRVVRHAPRVACHSAWLIANLISDPASCVVRRGSLCLAICKFHF